MGYPKRIKKFVKLERKANRSWKQTIKNIYNNSHILTSNLDWLHFGFATMALQSEHVATAIDAKMGTSLRGFDVDVYPMMHPDCYELLWKQVTKVHTISKYLLEAAYNLGLSNTIPYQIITPAVDILKINQVKEASERLQFLTIARLHWIKGLSYTLEAMAILKKQGLKFKYTIIGSGREYEEITFAIYQLQLSDNVHFIGKASHDDIKDYLSRTDIYLQYSHSEGFCNAVLEAQAMGCLCVVSDGGALTENVIHNQTGWIVPKRNSKVLAKRLRDVINLTESDKNKIRLNAQNRVISSFNLIKQQNEFAEFYY